MNRHPLVTKEQSIGSGPGLKSLFLVKKQLIKLMLMDSKDPSAVEFERSKDDADTAATFIDPCHAPTEERYGKVRRRKGSRIDSFGYKIACVNLHAM